MVTITTDTASITAQLTNLVNNMPQQVAQAVQQACLAIEAQAKNNCPVGSGDLRRSIQTEVKTEGDKTVGVVGTNLEYGVYVHEGTGIYSRSGAGRTDVPWVYMSEEDGKFYTTSGIQPTPFLEDAVNTLTPDIENYFRGLFGNA